MMKYTIKHDFGNGRLKKVTLADFSLGTQAMLHLGMVGLESIKARTARGIGSDDTLMPPLAQMQGTVVETKYGKRLVNKGQFSSLRGYAYEKMKLGLNPIRDLRGPGDKYKSSAARGKRTWGRVAYGGGGHMMDDLRVTYASPTQAKVDITTTMSRTKANANEQTIKRKGGSGWWGFSSRDTAKVLTAARAIFTPVIAHMQSVFRKAA